MEEALPSELTQHGLKMIVLDYSQTGPEECKLFPIVSNVCRCSQMRQSGMVETMISANTVPIDCSCSLWDDQMALYKASAHGNVHIIQVLIKMGTKANKICMMGQLHCMWYVKVVSVLKLSKSCDKQKPKLIRKTKAVKCLCWIF